MIERNGKRFYTADDINLDKVHEAMTAAGRRDRALPLEQLGNFGHRFAPKAPRPPAHDYGPHRPEDARVYEPVKVRIQFAWRHQPVDDLVHRQIARINHLAYEAAQRHRREAGL